MTTSSSASVRRGGSRAGRRPSTATRRTGCCPVLDQGPLVVGPHRGVGVLGRRVLDRVEAGADAADPEAVGRGQPAGPLVGVGGTRPFATQPKPSSTAPTCGHRRRGSNRTSSSDLRTTVLAPGSNVAPTHFLRRSSAWYRPLNTHRRTGGLIRLQPRTVGLGRAASPHRPGGQRSIRDPPADRTGLRCVGGARPDRPVDPSHLGVDESDLIGDVCSTTQAIAFATRAAGFHGILAPAAALLGRQTLAVFAHVLPSVEAERSEVRQPPPRIADLLPLHGVKS